MHEIGVLTKAVDMVEQVAKENHVKKVQYITLEIGELTGYLPVFFEKYFPIVVEDKEIVKDAQLKMNIIKGEAICDDCQTLYNVMSNKGQCPKCKSRNKKIIGGRDFLVKEIGYEVNHEGS